jgi:chemotaxis protein MotB
MAEVQQPIVIKKITINEAGHHGGAWKVAYADFVTAMMAFFLLLWLLASSSDAALEGIADYFTPTIGLKDSMGIGFEGGVTDAVEDGKRRNDTARPNIVSGQPPQGVKPKEPKKEAIIESPDGEDMLFDKAAAAVAQAVANDKTLSDLGENFRMEQTPEGLKIQVMDTEKDPMFQAGSIELTDAGKRLVGRIGEVIKGTPNHLSIVGHTDSVNPTRQDGTSNWELSTERANAARRYLRSQGMIEERVAKVQGRADKELLFSADPKNPKNRRIEFILLRGDHMVIPDEDNPAGGLLPIQDKSNDTLKFEDKLKQQKLEQQAPKEQAVAPAVSIPDEAIEEHTDSKDILEFTPN